jgi:hypothetical protein
MNHERELADLREGTEQLQDRIEDVKADWERKRRDPSVPGAPAPPNDPEAADGGVVAGDWEGEAPAANEVGQ